MAVTPVTMASSTKKEDRAKEAATTAPLLAKLHPHGDVYSPRTGHTVTSKDGRVYVFGGTDRRRRQQDLYQLEIETGTWSQSDIANASVPFDYSFNALRFYLQAPIRLHVVYVVNFIASFISSQSLLR
ncbi:Kelch-type beta propeller [Phytophthora cactorum]|nr:Kelch-type beta propeller [Phytophthora cactorum]